MTISDLADELSQCQQADGGWSYAGSASCTEPTAWVTLALRAAGGNAAAVARAESWMKTHQRADGGWTPRPEVEVRTWVTSLGLLVFPSNRRAFDWIMTQSGRDSRLTQRLREWMLGVKNEYESVEQAWSWYPETTSWVAPTAYAVLALRRSGRPEARARIASGQRFLAIRRCRDGGWNHGSARALGYEANSYPETTGLALAALAGTPEAQSAREVAERHLRDCRTAEGVAWLQLGLAASGWRTPVREMPRCRSAQDRALRLISALATEGHDPFAPDARSAA